MIELIVAIYKMHNYIKTLWKQELHVWTLNFTSPITAEMWVWSQVSSCKMCCGHSGTWQAFLSALGICPVSIIPLMHHIHVLFKTNDRILASDNVITQNNPAYHIILCIMVKYKLQFMFPTTSYSKTFC